jgi:hypothetical protein
MEQFQLPLAALQFTSLFLSVCLFWNCALNRRISGTDMSAVCGWFDVGANFVTSLCFGGAVETCLVTMATH